MKLILAVLFLVATAVPVLPQASPTAIRNGSRFVAGAGVSYFQSDWNGRLVGPTAWVDWNFYNSSPLLKGFGLELEVRDLNYAQVVRKMRMDTAEGGLIYTWRHYRRFNPYGKFLAGFGSIDFPNLTPSYSHDTRAVYAPGFGAEYRVLGSVWVRGDYEYQFWPDFIHNHALNPYGITASASYHFGHAY